MTAYAASLFLFLAIVASAVALLGQGRLRTAIESRFRALRQTQGEASATPRQAGDLRRYHSSIPTLQRLLSNRSWADEIALQLQQAGIQLRVGEFVFLRTLIAAILLLVTLIASRFQPAGLFAALVLAGLGFWLPSLYVNWMIRRRRTKIERQLIDLVPMLSSSLRAGFAFQQALEVASRQIGPPLGDELALLLSDVNLGATMQSALQDLGRRVGSTDLDMLITAILLQRTTGGNLSEVLDKTAETMAERERIRGDILTLTSQQRLTGLILSVYPICLGLLFLAIMPHLWSKLFTETVGRALLGIALGLQMIGFVAIRRALNVEI